jgi:hypothetical protein
MGQSSGANEKNSSTIDLLQNNPLAKQIAYMKIDHLVNMNNCNAKNRLLREVNYTISSSNKVMEYQDYQ